MSKNKEILFIAEAVSNEKGVAPGIILNAIETALERTTIKRSGHDINVKVTIDPKTGDYQTHQLIEVVEDDAVENSDQQIALSEAKKQKATIKVGDIIKKEMPSVEFGRIEVQAAKQILIRQFREAEREKVAEVYAQRKGQLISATVKKVTREQIELETGDQAEAILLREDMLPKDAYRKGDIVRAYLYDVRVDNKGARVYLSRTCLPMLMELFKLEVPEINEGVIEVMGAARDPGFRSKIAVKTNDGRIDPIGACIGMRGARVQAISNELGGERIDIILWDINPAQLVINAMAPAQVSSIVVDEESRTMDIAVKEDQLSLAIGRNGQNVRLASDLTGWKLNVMTESEAVDKNQQESMNLIKTFMEQLDIEQDVAEVLVQEGFTTLEEVAYVALEEFAAIEGFDEEIAKELQNRAQDALLTKAIAKQEKLAGHVPQDDLLALPGMTQAFALTLAEKGILTRDDLAEQSIDDLLEINGIDEEKAAELIMAARAHWFEEDTD